MKDEHTTNRDHRHLLSRTKDRDTTEIRTSKSGRVSAWHRIFLDQGHGYNTPGKRSK